MQDISRDSGVDREAQEQEDRDLSDFWRLQADD